MRIHSLLLLLTLVTSFACDGGASPTDAGTDAAEPPLDAGPDSGPDAGPAFDPTAVRFEPVTTTGEGPWGLWGFVTVALGDDRALVLGGTNAGSFGGEVFDTAYIVTVDDGEVGATAIEATGPAPRYCGCAGYDPMRDVVVVFGGRDLSGPTLAPETWELDLSTSTWTRVEAATQPTGTIGCAMGWAPSRGALYLFGGGGAGGFSADTYRYDAGTWTQLDADGPLARYDAVMMPDGDTLLLFGGSYNAVGSAFYADLWRFDPTTESWSEIALPEGPAGRRIAWMVRDPSRDGWYLGFGYDGEMPPFGDLWYLDLEALAWTSIPVPDDGPAPRGFSPALPGGSAALGTMIGGYSGRPTRDAWQLVR